METLNYKISSRATILLGRESVSKIDSAIIELVKNTYDADASFCLLCMDVEHDLLFIIDNGCGMTRNIIENHWMLIGTDNKKSEYQSIKGRVKSGEKGIGRFALDRLGNSCEMYTRSKSDAEVICWKTNWSQFEQSGKLLDEMSATIEYLPSPLTEYLPNKIIQQIESNTEISINTGTIFKIAGLRDIWDDKQIKAIINSLGYLLPSSMHKDFSIAVMNSMNSDIVFVENDITEEYDYKIISEFDGEDFQISLFRNEFDTNKIPPILYSNERFNKHPFRKEDFELSSISLKRSINELLSSNNDDIIREAKKIGKFKFEYIFMKLSVSEEQGLFCKEISKYRSRWMKHHAGIKIYRDSFWVRPYGEINGKFDWLGLDARKAKNPTAITHPGESWSVRNAQGYGVVSISRVYNPLITDMSSREGIIENDTFQCLQNILISLISLIERDRAYIARTFKQYLDEVNNKDIVKREASVLANKILNTNTNQIQLNNTIAKIDSDNQTRTLAEAVKFFKEERDELVSEVSLLRSLATNGLLTASIVHDLKSLRAQLVNRVDSIQAVIEMGDKPLIFRHMSDLKSNDQFLKSWITVITTQMKSDKRKRVKRDLFLIVRETIDMLKPILERKQINILIDDNNNSSFERRVFPIDIESIIYNLVINSMEAFEKSNIIKREIKITLKSDDVFTLNYHDNGKGIDELFQDPYEIFKFGTTSKIDSNGEKIGTGLGMYIVASTLREYNSSPKLLNWKNCFELQFAINQGG